MKTETTVGARVGSNNLLGNLLPVGTRIRFTQTLVSGPDEDGPGNLYAREGDLGEITGHGTREGYWVKWDHWKNPFGASRDEFEPLTPNAELYGKNCRITPITDSASQHKDDRDQA